MDSDEFLEFGQASLEFIIKYLKTLRERNVLPNSTPFALVQSLPTEIPEKAENWRNILDDLEHLILPHLTHWQSPRFSSYYPVGTSFGSIIGELLIAGIGVLGFNWICSPACTELEVVVMDWLAKFLNLPKHFLHSTEGPGGGIIQGSASESILVAVIAAREETVKRVKEQNPEMSESDIRGKLVAYSSDQSNSCVEKAGVLAAVPMRLVATGQDLIFNGKMLEQAIEEDLAKGLIPTVCVATMGTTGTCAYDEIPTLGEVCRKHKVWLHVDAAYAGVALALDEFPELRNGLELVDSLNFNLHKFLMVNFDCTAMWLKDANRVVDSFNVDRIYLKHKYEGQTQIPDFRHWQIPLGRRFRALKVWITFRTVGAEGLRANIRHHILLAERFEKYVLADSRFEMVTKRSLGLVCFRPKGDNQRTIDLLNNVTERKKIYMIQAKHRGCNFLRFVVCGMEPKEEDIDFAWNEIQTQMDLVLEQERLNSIKSDVNSISQKLTTDLNITAVNECEKSK